MSIQSEEFLRFIKLLNDNDCLEYVILVGSWAEFLYGESGIMPGFEPNIKTLDIDFLLKNLRRPVVPVNLINLAKAEGYLVDSDYITGATKIMDKHGLEIEFILSKAGAGTENVLRTNLGVTAQTLRHMNIIAHNTRTIEYYEMPISVPEPEAYIIQKMIINDQRGVKKEKDRLAVINLWPYINKDTFSEIYNCLTKKEKTIVDSFLKNNNMIFRTD